MTSYDEIYEEFLSRCKVDDIDLPDTNEKIYAVIRSAVRDFNNKMRTQIMCDDELESVNQKLSDDDLLILAHYLRLNFLRNQLIHFSSTWQPFAKDIGLKNFQSQLKALETLVSNEKENIKELIVNTLDDFM
ncbi:hypothetical protein MKY95_10120 [Paenibacillus sp. FSL P4-0176]|uniref:hypothetical protein n=1 Tax=Paenibacillus sp. FSL P4-0176 TaxID=2921631 RepID=UPI0030CEEE3D